MLELQRNVIFGQFVDTGSPIHRLDPRIKLAATALFVVFSFLIPNPIGFLILFPLLAIIQVVSRVPFGYLLRGSRIFLVFLLFISIFQILFYPRPVPEEHVLWRWWIMSVSTDAIVFAINIGLRVVLLYYVTTMLMLTTSLVDLTDGIELIFHPLQRVRVPVNELVLVSVIAFKFVPIFIAEVERLSRAQTARGVPFDEGGTLKRARRLGRLLVPIFIGGFQRADLLTMAMDTRCYQGGAGRTKLREMRTTPVDWLALAFLFAWLVFAWQVSGRVRL